MERFARREILYFYALLVLKPEHGTWKIVSVVDHHVFLQQSFVAFTRTKINQNCTFKVSQILSSQSAAVLKPIIIEAGAEDFLNPHCFLS